MPAQSPDTLQAPATAAGSAQQAAPLGPSSVGRSALQNSFFTSTCESAGLWPGPIQVFPVVSSPAKGSVQVWWASAWPGELLQSKAQRLLLHGDLTGFYAPKGAGCCAGTWRRCAKSGTASMSRRHPCWLPRRAPRLQRQMRGHNSQAPATPPDIACSSSRQMSCTAEAQRSTWTSAPPLGA